MSSRQIFGLLTFLSIVIYLGSIWYLMRYLRRAYTMLWVDLGEPTLPINLGKRTLTNPFGYLRDGGLGIIRFVFSNQYKKIDDPRLTNLIWVVRAALAATAVLVIIEFAL